MAEEHRKPPSVVPDPVVLRPEDRHRCNLPDATTLPRNTLVRCGECRTWSVLRESHAAWSYPDWWPVHWWHFRLRRRIRQVELTEGAR